MANRLSSPDDPRAMWEAAAPGWVKWEGVIAAGFADATERLLDMAGVRQAMRVLDVACGGGSQSVAAARRVGPGGEVLATDISPAMLEHVRRRAAREGLGHIHTLESAAEEFDRGLPPFDAAICRLGLMLFPSPPRALDAIRRALAPGARFAALVFTTPARNGFLAQPMATLLRHAGKAPPGPGTPGLFALGSPGALEAQMAGAGFTAIETRTVEARLRLPSARDALRLLQEAAPPFRAAAAALDDAAKDKAWAEVLAGFRSFESHGALEAPLEALITAGATPR
ncbi:MAG: methyltransferase domain-containing protein [Myxococcales bacterium]|nr:methyltransferase domain-containing protein [Myxococcales bacterium]